VLRSLVVALEKHIAFSEQNGVPVERTFSDLLIQLISNRPSVFAAALDSYSIMRSLSVRVLHSNFTESLKRTGENEASGVTIKLFKTQQHEGGTVHLPLALLQSICVVLSIWKDENAQDNDEEETTAVNNFVGALLRPAEDHSDEDSGLASAKIRDDGPVETVHVESVRVF